MVLFEQNNIMYKLEYCQQFSSTTRTNIILSIISLNRHVSFACKLVIWIHHYDSIHCEIQTPWQ